MLRSWYKDLSTEELARIHHALRMSAGMYPDEAHEYHALADEAWAEIIARTQRGGEHAQEGSDPGSSHGTVADRAADGRERGDQPRRSRHAVQLDVEQVGGAQVPPQLSDRLERLEANQVELVEQINKSLDRFNEDVQTLVVAVGQDINKLDTRLNYVERVIWQEAKREFPGLGSIRDLPRQQGDPAEGAAGSIQADAPEEPQEAQATETVTADQPLCMRFYDKGFPNDFLFCYLPNKHEGECQFEARRR